MRRDLKFGLALLAATVGVMVAVDPGPPAWLRGAGAALMAALALFAILSDALLLRLLRRGLAVMLPVFTVVAVVVAIVVALDLDDWRVTQAVVAAVVVAAGWFAGFLLRESGQQLARAEKLRDIHRALYAEISHNLVNLGERDALIGFGNDMVRRMAGPDAYLPLVPREKNDTIFQAMVEDLSILPRTSIDPIVQYYSQLAAHDALVEDMRGEAFRALAPWRRAEIYADYIGLRLNLIDYGLTAAGVIDAYAKGDRPAAEAWLEQAQ